MEKSLNARRVVLLIQRIPVSFVAPLSVIADAIGRLYSDERGLPCIIPFTLRERRAYDQL